jgi:polo-like kinase 1
VKPVNPEDHDKHRKIITYARGRFLGKGGFAKCYEVKRIEPIETEEHETQTWALKVVPKVNLTRTKARQKLTSEIKIHRSMDHEHVVRFDRYFEDKENVYIMLDICTNGSLSDLIKRRKRLHEVETRYYIYQLVKAIQYVHSRKVIHRDLKLGNLFLTDRMGVKVGDFGLAAQVFYQGEKKRTVCGTPNYLAPEVLEANGGHSYEVDYWSIGVILYTMLNGRPPFES